jgi:lipoprotein-anchoring transpeptidase ErfK/SrfK
MDARRLTEMLGAFVLGGGLVAVTYELASPRTAAPGATGATAWGGADQARVAAGGGGHSVPGADEPAPAGESAGAAAEASAPAMPTDDRPPAQDLAPWLVADEQGRYGAFPPIFREPPPFDAAAESEFDAHGLVTSLAVVVRAEPSLESPMSGVLRSGQRIRVKQERIFGGGCEKGWNKIWPQGFICREAGLAVEKTPPDAAVQSLPDPALDQPLPYDYWRVKDEMTPFFHRLPSFEEQDLADAAGAAWRAAQGRAPMPTHPAQRPKEVPAVVKEYMNSGYYVTRAGEEVKSQRRFLRTTRGTYARKYQLMPKDSPQFKGIVLPGSELELPVYFVRRELALMKREGEGIDVLLESDRKPERLATYPFTKQVYIGEHQYYEDAEGYLMRAYAVSRAYVLKRPAGLAADERWIHVDLSEQTLVAYEGDTPVFVTLVSTGKEPGMTPVGIHRVQSKHIATSMRDQPEAEEAYSIEDVPWTQYFHNSVALHGAFWHAGFGLVRSHGCVNLSPSDARWLFGFTGPALPDGWHSVYAATGDNDAGTAIVITE